MDSRKQKQANSGHALEEAATDSSSVILLMFPVLKSSSLLYNSICIHKIGLKDQ